MRKEYLFALSFVENGKKQFKSHTEWFDNLADASIRGREILKEAKRDGLQVIQIDVYEIKRKHIVSYQ